MILFYAAVIPVIVLCYFIYAKDANREPGKLLAKIFAFGFFSAIPVVLVELLLGKVFSTEGVTDIFTIFVNVFISIALVEESFKWLITKVLTYNDREFDEVYDIIVYSVFASLGFACIENILYVLGGGLHTAILRAILSIPGHMCFGVIMGYFFAQAKLADANGNKGLQMRNLIFSILMPALAHTIYDALLFATSATENGILFVLFLLFDIAMVVVCFITVSKVSKMQQKINQNMATGVIEINPAGTIQYSGTPEEKNFCPICGQPAKGFNYCNSCGYKLK